MIELLFVTNNEHKLKEVKAAIDQRFRIMSLNETGFVGEIPETHETLEENALEKARYIHNVSGKNCFADDTGLEIEALNGRPGVYSARYAGDQPSFDDNMNKVLMEMKDVSNRKARFRTVIALILDHKEYLFEGLVEGIILTEKRGTDGFGYDPLFLPEGYSQTFAEMPLPLKNQISHRGRAVRNLLSFLQHYIPLSADQQVIDH
jgi:XTP/dITP diphosphohydrolase